MNQPIIGRKQLSGILGLCGILAICAMATWGDLDAGVAIAAIVGVGGLFGTAAAAQGFIDHKNAGPSMPVGIGR